MKRYLNFKKILDLLTQINIWSIVFFVPIFFAFFIKTNNVFELNKIVLFKILILLLLFFTSLKYLFYEKTASLPLQWKRIKKNKTIVTIFFFFFLSLILSTCFSSFFEKSLWGSYERQLGFSAYLYFLTFFLLIYINLRNKKEVYLILKTLLFSSFFVSIYAIVQFLGLDLFSWIESTELRAISTLGQPNFLGAFLLLVIPLNIYFYKEGLNYFKYSYLVNLFASILALGFTYSISSWIGGVFALFVSLLLYFSVNKNKFFQKIYLKYWLGVFVLFVFLPLFFISSSHVFKAKINSVINFENGSTAARINYWQASIKTIKERPILGHGLDTQGEVLAKYYETDWGVHSNVGVRPDRAHNIFLDILLTTGALGLISYLLLLFLFFRIIFLNIKQKKEVFLNAIIAIALSSYLVTLLFNFTFITGEIIFWLYFAIVLKIYFLEEPKEEAEVHKQKTEYRVARIIFKIVIILVFSYLIMGKIKMETNKIIADKYYLDIRQARINDEYFRALVLYDYINELNIEANIYNIKVGKILADWTPEIEQYGKIFNIKGAEYMSKIYSKIEGTEYENRLARASILSVLSRDNVKYLEEAEQGFLNIIRDYPGMPRNYYNLALFYFHNERYDEAEDMLRGALERVPEKSNKNLNYDHLQKVKEERFMNRMLLGDIYNERDNFDIAINLYEKAGQLLEKPITFYRLANAYKEKDDFNKAIWYNKKSIGLNEDNHIWHYYLAETYFKSGDYESSLSELNKALEIFPYHSESNTLKQEIKEKQK